MTESLASPAYVGDLGNGLIRRWSTPADQEKIAQLLGDVYRNNADEPINVRTLDTIRVLMSPGFPLMGPGDFAIVEDTSKPAHPVVACTCLFRHEWSYGGIRFGVGRPEYVGADPAYRNRGLVRAVFEMIHARSAAEGHWVQGITGIPYFYRQFGYEYVLDLEGRRTTYLSLIPEKKNSEPEPYALRLATVADIPYLMALYEQHRHNSLVQYEPDEAYWRHEITAWDDPAAHDKDVLTIGLGTRLYMMVNDQGQACGCTILAVRRGGPNFAVFHLQLDRAVNLQTAMPVLLRLLRTQAMQAPTIKADTAPLSEISFMFGRAHPVYDILGDALAPRVEPPYAWYLRVADAPGFLHHITPVLEERLAKSVLVGHTGELKIDFYRGGLRLEFAHGKLVVIEPWRAPSYGNDAEAGCPPLVFLKLLFGYRSLAELRSFYPDVWANPEAALLLNTLFPAQPSTIQLLW
ncbi:MAG: GNAT family N-acetyltransferase [Caldilineaceae bacterium]